MKILDFLVKMAGPPSGVGKRSWNWLVHSKTKKNFESNDDASLEFYRLFAELGCSLDWGLSNSYPSYLLRLKVCDTFVEKEEGRRGPNHQEKEHLRISSAPKTTSPKSTHSIRTSFVRKERANDHDECSSLPSPFILNQRILSLIPHFHHYYSFFIQFSPWMQRISRRP